MKIYNKVVMDIDGCVIEEDSFEYTGEVAQCGGGSVSGTIDYPSYLKNVHNNWLSGDPIADSDGTEIVADITTFMNTAIGGFGNPYDSEVAYDPNAAVTLVADSPLDNIETEFAIAKGLVAGLDAAVDWKAYVTAAATKFTSFDSIDFLSSLTAAIAGMLSAVESAMSSTSITAMVTAFENNKKVRFLRQEGIFAAGMADLNAVHTSSFIIAKALNQIEFDNSVDSFERELKIGLYNTIVGAGIQGHIKAEVLQSSAKDSILMQGATTMQRIDEIKTQLTNQLSGMKAEIEKLTIIALKEQTDRDLSIDIEDASWDMSVFEYGTNVLSGIAGTSTVGRPKQTSTAQSVLGGAAAGAAIGAAIPVPGAMAIGAGAGAILGWALN